MNLEEFYQNTLADAGAASLANNVGNEFAFIEESLGELVDIAVLNDFEITNYYNKNKGFKVDAWYYDETSRMLNLIISEFSSDFEIQTLTETNLNKAINRPQNFFQKCLDDPDFKRSLEDSDPISTLAWKIYDLRNLDITLKVILISNKILSKRTKNLKLAKNLKLDVWDLQRFYELSISGESKEPIEIDFTHTDKNGIDILEANNSSSDIKSYLFVLNGNTLAIIYDDWGERLLESNVRTFLQRRGKVNDGMRKTIASNPDRFFSYNNGITATAEEVNINSDGKLVGIKNFQIVNGGQTTASIFTSRLIDKAPLDNVFVQVKMSVINSKLSEELVPKISEFSNTQNKVSITDFASNKAWNIKLEEISRRLLAPPSQDGATYNTHWFYERTRGQYANAQLKLTASQTKAFLNKNPKNQKFDKTYLAKVSNSFDMIPDLVSKGAQVSFGHFVDKISKLWEENEANLNDNYYKTKIAQIILFKHIDRLIFKTLGGAYKAQVLAYTISKLTLEAKGKDLTWPYEKIWNEQTISEDLSRYLETYSKKMRKFLEESGMEVNKDVAQWAKVKGCWEKAKDFNIGINQSFLNQLISLKAVEKKQKKREKKSV